MRNGVPPRISRTLVCYLAVTVGVGRPAAAPTDPIRDPSNTSAATCSLQPGPARTVTRIIDGETLGLDDGKEVRLIGAMAPRARDAGAEPGAWPLEEAAKTSLAEMTLGKRVELAYGAAREDRYGRHLAHLFIDEGGKRLWVQGEMLQLGLARAYALPGDATCLAELIANEAIARTAGAGVWTSQPYSVRPSGKTFALSGLRSTFQIVRGTVAEVSRTKSAVYLNFGSDWHSDFTVLIGKRLLTANPQFDHQLDGLKGLSVEVRGWIDRRNGPMIALTSPSEIKLTDDQPSGGPGAPLAQAPALQTPAAGTLAAPVAGQESAPAPQRKKNRPRRGATGDVDL